MPFFRRRFEEEVLSWPLVSAHPHQFAAREFRYQGKAEIGHLHLWGDLDIPFPRAIHDALLEAGQARQHRWLPDSGWVTFHVGSSADFEHAIRLMRLSYARYALKGGADPREFLKKEAEQLQLGSKIPALLESLLPPKATPATPPTFSPEARSGPSPTPENSAPSSPAAATL